VATDKKSNVLTRRKDRADQMRADARARTSAGEGGTQMSKPKLGKLFGSKRASGAATKTSAASKPAAKIEPVEVKKHPRSPASPPVSSVKTKGGDYPVYKKDSGAAQSFRTAFAAARKEGKKTFTWNGRSYTTEVK